MKKLWVLCLSAVMLCAALTGCNSQGNPPEIVQAQMGSEASTQAAIKISAKQFEEQFNKAVGKDRAIELEKGDSSLYLSYSYFRENKNFFNVQCDNDDKYVSAIYLSCPLEDHEAGDILAYKEDVKAAIRVLDPSLTDGQIKLLLESVKFEDDPERWTVDKMSESEANQIHYYTQKSSKLNNLQFFISAQELQ